MVKIAGIILALISILGSSSLALAQVWERFETKGGISTQVTDITEDEGGDLWISTFGGGVGHYNKGDWTRFSTENGLSSDKVFTIFQDSKNRLWFATDRGVIKYEEGKWVTFTTKDGLAGHGVVPILEDRNGNVWVGTSGGVSRYDGRDWTSYTSQDFLANKTQAIVEDREGNLWFGTYGGVIKYNRVSWITYNEGSGLVNDFVTALMIDNNGTLWAGTLGGGLSSYNGKKWTTVIPAAPKDNETPFSVSDILEDRNGKLWLGVSGKGVMSYDGSTWTTFGRKDGLVSEEVNTLYEDREGNLLVGTWEGISKLEGMSQPAPLLAKPSQTAAREISTSVPVEKPPAEEEAVIVEAMPEPTVERGEETVEADTSEANRAKTRSFWSVIGLKKDREVEPSEVAAGAAVAESSPTIEEKTKQEKSKESQIAIAAIPEKKNTIGESRSNEVTYSAKELAVESAKIASGVQSLNPVGVGDRFSKDIGRLYLWSRIINGANTTISHIWYYKRSKIAEVKLDISSNRFRTYSSKGISPSLVGDWRVDIVDETGVVLESLNFVVTDQEG